MMDKTIHQTVGPNPRAEEAEDYLKVLFKEYLEESWNQGEEATLRDFGLYLHHQ